MSWFKVDDGFPLHPKSLAAGNAAVGLWVRAGSWCAQQLTDGLVPASMAQVLGGRPVDIKRLVAVCLWHGAGHACPRCAQPDDGWVFHDWSVYNPSREHVLAERTAAAERQRKARDKARESRRDSGVSDGEVQTPSRVPRPDPAPGSDPDGSAAATLNERAQALARAYTDLVPLSKFPAIMVMAKKAIDAGYPDQAIDAALRRLAAEGRPVTIDVLRVELEGLPTVRRPNAAADMGPAMERARAAEAREVAAS